MTKIIYKFDPDYVRFILFVFYKKCLSNQLGYVSLGEHLSFNTGKMFDI